MNYTYSIISSLSILGDFDRDKIKAIEERLLIKLKAAGINKSRYDRLKYDRGHQLIMKIDEANIIYDFFQERFSAKAKATDNDRSKIKIQAWAPNTINDLYYSPEAVRSGL